MQDRRGSIRNILARLNTGFQNEMGHGREDYRQALKRGYAAQNKETDGSKWNQTMGSNRTVTLMRELAGKADPEQVRQRNDMGIGLSGDKWERRGQIAGALVSDIVQDRGRSIWWLLNAPQATANVLQEGLLHKMAPQIYQSKPIKNPKGGRIKASDKDAATLDFLVKEGYIGPETMKPTAGVTIDKDGYYNKRNYEPGHAELLSIPAGLAVNTAVGLMSPFGGSEGYKAVFPDEQDPTKTSNVLAEVGAKYLLGRTGQLLNWDDFKEARPDVSKDEYMRYKAFKFDNKMDLNPFDDGKMVAPTGVLKYTNEGIHGPEVQFLGKSLPVATGVMPAAAAMLGTAYGARRGGIRGGLIGGAASTAGGMLLGNIIEGERRRRNKAENERDTIEQ